MAAFLYNILVYIILDQKRIGKRIETSSERLPLFIYISSWLVS